MIRLWSGIYLYKNYLVRSTSTFKTKMVATFVVSKCLSEINGITTESHCATVTGWSHHARTTTNYCKVTERWNLLVTAWSYCTIGGCHCTAARKKSSSVKPLLQQPGTITQHPGDIAQQQQPEVQQPQAIAQQGSHHAIAAAWNHCITYV